MQCFAVANRPCRQKWIVSKAIWLKKAKGEWEWKWERESEKGERSINVASLCFTIPQLLSLSALYFFAQVSTSLKSIHTSIVNTRWDSNPCCIAFADRIERTDFNENLFHKNIKNKKKSHLLSSVELNIKRKTTSELFSVITASYQPQMHSHNYVLSDSTIYNRPKLKVFCMILFTSSLSFPFRLYYKYAVSMFICSQNHFFILDTLIWIRINKII